MRTVVRARIDEKIKEEAAAVLDTFGLTVSDAFRLMMVRIATEKRLPFELLVPNEETLAAMQAAERGEFGCRRRRQRTHGRSRCGRLGGRWPSSETASARSRNAAQRRGAREAPPCWEDHGGAGGLRVTHRLPMSRRPVLVEAREVRRCFRGRGPVEGTGRRSAWTDSALSEPSPPLGGAAIADANDVRFVAIVTQVKDYAVVANSNASCLGCDVDETADVRVAGFGETVKCPVDEAGRRGMEGEDVFSARGIQISRHVVVRAFGESGHPECSGPRRYRDALRRWLCGPLR